MAFLEQEKDERVKKKSSYYERALQVCTKVEEIYQVELLKQEKHVEESEEDEKSDGGRLCRSEAASGGATGSVGRLE